VRISYISSEIFKRRVQIPLPESIEDRMVRIQKRFALNSNAAVVQLAIGFLHHLFEVAELGGEVFVESKSGMRPLHSLALLGDTSSPKSKREIVVKYQISIDRNQDKILRNIGSTIGASSVAESVRFAIRVLDSLGRHVARDEAIVAVLANGDEVLLSLD
jgi:hypothetical protein